MPTTPAPNLPKYTTADVLEALAKTADCTLTVPEVAAAVGIKLDRFRLLLRRNAKLPKLFTTVGNRRVTLKDFVPTITALLADLGELRSSSNGSAGSSPNSRAD